MKQGKPKTDKNNPDPALRSRPDLGLELLKDFTFDGDNVYSRTAQFTTPKTAKPIAAK